MTREFRIEVRAAGTANAAQVNVSGDGQAAQRMFPRVLPTLVNAQTLDLLQRGDAQPAEVEQLSTAVSDWLLGADVREILRTLVQQRAGPPLRLVFSVDQGLESAVGDLPVELLRTDPAADHLVLHPRIDGLVRLLPKVVTAPVSNAALEWPMRILVIRSNPLDLGGRVPEAGALRQEILDLAKTTFGGGRVQIDLLSREAGSLGPPTWEEFIKVAKAQYHIFVYLGHGDLQQLHEDLPPLSQLQFEVADGNEHEPVTAKQLANLLREHPIPVVMLAGCLTAAVPGNGNDPDVATSLQGNQGVAQALVNSESGVTLAVGMRSKVDGSDVELFLKAFFSALFKDSGDDSVGNVERSVKKARQRLFQRRFHPPTWASPVVFSNLMPEPIFQYLRQPTAFVPSQVLNRDLDVRRQMLWPILAEMPAGRRPATVQNAVQANRDAIRTEMTRIGAAMILPELVDAHAGTNVQVPVAIEGTLSFTSLQARVSLSNGLQFVTAKSTTALTTAGYQLLVDSNAAEFELKRRPGGNATVAMPAGVLLELELTVDTAALGACVVNLEVIHTDANQPYWAGHNAVIVQI